MKVRTSFKKIEHTPSLDERINEKSKKLEKYFHGNTDVHWVCYVKDGQHWADIKAVGPKFEYFATAHSESLYKTLDLAVNKLEKQIKKKKEKWKNQIHDQDSFKGSKEQKEEYGAGYVDSIFNKTG